MLYQYYFTFRQKSSKKFCQAHYYWKLVKVTLEISWHYSYQNLSKDCLRTAFDRKKLLYIQFLTVLLHNSDVVITAHDTKRTMFLQFFLSLTKFRILRNGQLKECLGPFGCLILIAFLNGVSDISYLSLKHHVLHFLQQGQRSYATLETYRH